MIYLLNVFLFSGILSLFNLFRYSFTVLKKKSRQQNTYVLYKMFNNGLSLMFLCG